VEYVLQKMEPTKVQLGDQEIPMLFSLRAAAEMEERLDTPYPQILRELFQQHEEGEPEPPPMAWARQAEVVACLVRGAGCEMSAETLMELHITQFNTLCQGALREILYKTPQTSKKK